MIFMQGRILFPRFYGEYSQKRFHLQLGVLYWIRLFQLFRLSFVRVTFLRAKQPWHIATKMQTSPGGGGWGGGR